MSPLGHPAKRNETTPSRLLLLRPIRNGTRLMVHRKGTAVSVFWRQWDGSVKLEGAGAIIEHIRADLYVVSLRDGLAAAYVRHVPEPDPSAVPQLPYLTASKASQAEGPTP